MGRMHVESLEPRALLTVTLGDPILSDTVEIDDNVVVQDGSRSITATGGPSSDGHVQIFGNSRGRIDGTVGQSGEDLSIIADTFITVTGAIGATQRIDDLTLTSATAKPVNLQQSVSLTGNLRVTQAGAFTIGSTVDIDGNLTIDAATNVMFSGNVTVDGNLTITNATSVLFAGTLTVGGQLTIANVTGSTRFAGDVTVGAAAIRSMTLVQVQADFASTGTAGDGDVTFTTDQVGFTTATIQSTAVSGPASAPSATLTVKPWTASRALTIASPSGAPSGLNITDPDLNAIRAGWKRVVLGDEIDGTGAVRIGSIGSQYGGFSQMLNTTTIVGGTIRVEQPVDVTSEAAYLELIARGSGSPGTGALTINAPINQTAEERNNWVRLTSAGSISINAPIWATETVSLTTTAGGTITQGGSSAAISTEDLAVKAAGAVTLADAGNAVDIVAFETSDATAVFREDSGYSIGQIATTDSARDVPVSVTVTGINAGTATVRLVTVSGATASSVTQTHRVLTGALGLEGTGTAWTLTHAANDLVGILAANTGSVEFRDFDDLTIGTVAAVTPQSAISGITVARTLDVTAGTTLTITAAGDIVSSATSGTAVNLSAASGIATAGDVTTAGGDVKFNHATTLTGDVTIDVEDGANRGTARFLSTVNADSAGAQGLTVTGKLNAGDSIGATTALKSLSVSNDATLAAGVTLRTTGNQTYSGAATSGGSVTIQAGSGSTVSFQGRTSLGGLVTATGDTSAYNVSLTGSPVSITNAVTFANTGTVTLGDQSTDDLLFVGGVTSTAPVTTKLAGTVRTTDAAGSFGRKPGGVVELIANTTVSTGLGNATFGGTVDGPYRLDVNATGDTTFSSAVGGGTALTHLETDAPGRTLIDGGSVRTASPSSQVYNDDVLLGANTVLTADNGGGVTFVKTLNGGYTLAVNTTGTTTFGGTVGNGTPLKSLTTDAGGTTRINGGAVTTNDAGGQSYGDDLVIGVADATLTAGTGPVTFHEKVDSATAGEYGLTVSAAGQTTFQKDVGSTALEYLITSGGGTTRINGGNVTTSGAAGQSYGDDVVLGVDATLTAGVGTVIFHEEVNSATAGEYGLIVSAAGQTTFQKAVGTTALEYLTTSGGGTTRINGTNVTTSGVAGQSYGDDVVLGVDATLTAGVGPVTFNGTIDSATGTARALTVNSQGVTWFAGNVGVTRPLASLTTNPLGSTRITAATVKTSGLQTYNDRVTFEPPVAPTGFTTLSVPQVLMIGSTVSLLQGLDAFGRSLRIEGNAVFGDQPGSPASTDDPNSAIDAVVGLNGLTVTGLTTINSNVVGSSVVAPTNPVVFQGGVTLGSDVTIFGSGIWFQSTVAGPGRTFMVRALAFGGTSSVVFDGDVGTVAAPLGPITVFCPAGAVNINATIYSTGPVIVAAGSIDGDADNAIRVPGSTISLTASTGIGATTPIAVEASSITASTTAGGIQLRGLGDLVIGTPGLSAPGTIALDASGRILVPTGGQITGGTVSATKTIDWSVFTTAATGVGSLAQVITNANATRAASMLVFPAGATVFPLTGLLPTIATQMTINGTSGGGSVVFDGNSSVASGLVFAAQAAGSSLSNVQLRNFTGFGVQLVGVQNMVVDTIVVQSLNTSTSMGLYATGTLSGTRVIRSSFSGGLRGALLDNARNLVFGQIGDGNVLSNNRAAPSQPNFAGTGIRAQGDCAGTVVAANTFNANNYGFAFVGAQNLRLTGNTFTRNTIAGIFVDGSCVGSMQAQNTFGTGTAKNKANIARTRTAKGV